MVQYHVTFVVGEWFITEFMAAVTDPYSEPNEFGPHHVAKGPF